MAPYVNQNSSDDLTQSALQCSVLAFVSTINLTGWHMNVTLDLRIHSIPTYYNLSSYYIFFHHHTVNMQIYSTVEDKKLVSYWRSRGRKWQMVIYTQSSSL